MGNTSFDDLPMLKAIVEDYIYTKKGKRIKVIFDNPMMMNKHFKMLCDAYYFIMTQQNENN